MSIITAALWLLVYSEHDMQDNLLTRSELAQFETREQCLYALHHETRAGIDLHRSVVASYATPSLRTITLEESGELEGATVKIYSCEAPLS